MSQNNSILNLLGIEDQNIKVLKVETILKNNEEWKLIHASLTYPVDRCKNCGFKSVVKNGLRKTDILRAERQPRACRTF